MFKFIFFIKNHVLGHALGMSNESVVEKLKKNHAPLWMGISAKLMWIILKCFVQINMKLMVNYVLWWNKWLGEWSFKSKGDELQVTQWVSKIK